MKKRTLLILIAGIFSIVGIAAIGLTILPGYLLGTGMSSRGEIVEVTSPDGKYVASGCHVWGGATVQDLTIIEIRPNGGWFKQKSEPLLIVDMTQSGNNPFDIAWADNNNLKVGYTPGSIYIQKFSWKDVTVKYVQK